MKRYRFQGAVLTSLLLGFLLTNCAWFGNPKKVDNSSGVATQKKGTAGEVANAAGQAYYVVKADFTPLYRSGPQQPNGPDQSLPKDTLVTLLKKGYGYSRVQLEGGLNGYVATDDLAPAPPERIAPPPAAQDDSPRSSAIVERFRADDNGLPSDTSLGNAEALPELPEPRLEPEPTPTVKPDFRY